MATSVAATPSRKAAAPVNPAARAATQVAVIQVAVVIRAGAIQAVARTIIRAMATAAIPARATAKAMAATIMAAPTIQAAENNRPSIGGQLLAGPDCGIGHFR